MFLGMVPDGQSAPSTRLAWADGVFGLASFPACGSRAPEAHQRRHRSRRILSVPPCVKALLGGAARSSFVVPALLVHSCSHPLGLVDLFVVRTVKQESASSHLECLLLLPLPLTSARELLR